MLKMALPPYTQLSMAFTRAELAVIGSSFIVALWLLWKSLILRKNASKLPLPPYVPITDYELLHSPIEKMTEGLQKHGPVIMVKRNGRKEYLVSEQFTRRILTEDKSFSFENGMAEVLGINWLINLHEGSFFRDLDIIARDFSGRRLNQAVPKIWPIFERVVSEITEAGRKRNPTDIWVIMQSTMAEVAITIFLGQKYNNVEYQKSVIALSQDITELMGLVPNKSWAARKLPFLWHPYTWIRIMLIRIPWDFGRKFSGELWADISVKYIPRDTKDETIVQYLMRRYAGEDGYVPILSRIWIMVLIITIAFVSVHTTVAAIIWVTFYLALYPETQKIIHEEISSIVREEENADGSFILDSSGIAKAVKTDSFIREVMRMKGDTINVARLTMKDVELGGYRIPKGYLVFPVAYLSNRSPECYSDPNVFNPLRWVGTGKSAGTAGAGYMAFGLGRWSCPGRFLGIMEMKTWILALVKHSQIELEGGKFDVFNWYNIASVPPQGRLLIDKRE
ncbi:hypothetical protein GTR04_6522 [Trichophyton interdigitale]|nr:hypothetical protein GY631_5138 [Trichophyton interdigitale]KAG5218898.1 hypothetical protein GY632_5100 [Trichophyton interdigitale]KAG8206097.1 hypothetical protein GTR04_6522 [Trichophyton interdigitale]